MHVRITDNARRILNNKALANKVIDAILSDKKALLNGEKVAVDNTQIKVTLVTSIPDKVADNKCR
jgi:hypothetical protein